MSTRSLWPREHGAYVQLGAPMVVAVVGWPSVAGGLIALGAFAAFLAHEPLTVLAGRRGRRALAEQGPRARSRLALCAAIAVAGVVGLVLAPGALATAAAVAGAGALLAGLSWRGHAHSLAGELLAAVALSGAAAPAAVAGGLASSTAFCLWLSWSLAFAATVVAVHVVIVAHKGRATPRRWLEWWSLLAATGAGLVVLSRESAAFLIAAPLWLAALAVVVLRPPATRLRRIGVVLAGTAGGVALGILAVMR